MPERFWSPYLAASSEYRRLTAIEHPSPTTEAPPDAGVLLARKGRVPDPDYR